MRLVLSSSIKFQYLVQTIHQKLMWSGHTVYNPFAEPYALDDLLPDSPIKGISKAHWYGINKADAFVIVNPDQYMGRKTMDTMNYARTIHKKVYFYCGGPNWQGLVK